MTNGCMPQNVQTHAACFIYDRFEILEDSNSEILVSIEPFSPSLGAELWIS